jgi:hypothetical protein
VPPAAIAPPPRKGVTKMNWFDAERQVLDRHDEAWRMGAAYQVGDRLQGAALRNLSLRRVSAGLGARLVGWGYRLQGLHGAASTTLMQEQRLGEGG